MSDSAAPWTTAQQAPLSMGILQTRILEWVAMPSEGFPNPGIEPRSPALKVDSLPSEPLVKQSYLDNYKLYTDSCCLSVHMYTNMKP